METTLSFPPPFLPPFLPLHHPVLTSERHSGEAHGLAHVHPFRVLITCCASARNEYILAGGGWFKCSQNLLVCACNNVAYNEELPYVGRLDSPFQVTSTLLCSQTLTPLRRYVLTCRMAIHARPVHTLDIATAA